MRERKQHDIPSGEATPARPMEGRQQHTARGSISMEWRGFTGPRRPSRRPSRPCPPLFVPSSQPSPAPPPSSFIPNPRNFNPSPSFLIYPQLPSGQPLTSSLSSPSTLNLFNFNPFALPHRTSPVPTDFTSLAALSSLISTFPLPLFLHLYPQPTSHHSLF